MYLLITFLTFDCKYSHQFPTFRYFLKILWNFGPVVCSACLLHGKCLYNTQVFKLWVATQTWVTIALTLEPFYDPPKIKIKYKKSTTKRFCTSCIASCCQISGYLGALEVILLCNTLLWWTNNIAAHIIFSVLSRARFWCWNFGRREKSLKTPTITHGSRKGETLDGETTCRYWRKRGFGQTRNQRKWHKHMVMGFSSSSGRTPNDDDNDF